MPEPLLEVRDLIVEYPSRKGPPLRAVDRISLQIGSGEILGLVGESGCGKTTAGMALVGLVPITGGDIVFDGKLWPKTAKQWKELRRQVAFVFQDPYASLDPYWRVGATISEPLQIHGIARGSALKHHAERLADLVGIEASLLSRRPHELSGGQRQRVAVARALATEPKLIIADEPTAALDVSIRAQVLNLLKELQGRLGLSILFISHDLSTVGYLADRVAVMYAGALVETGPAYHVLENPVHPYSTALIRALPDVGNFGVLPPVLEGEVPDLRSLPSGCRFRTRCALAQKLCAEKEPKLENHGKSMVACHFADDILMRK